MNHKFKARGIFMGPEPSSKCCRAKREMRTAEALQPVVFRKEIAVANSWLFFIAFIVLTAAGGAIATWLREAVHFPR